MIQMMESQLKKKIIKNYTELSRLSWVVRNIDVQCNLVPEGSIQLTPLHELQRNKSFKGIPKTEIEEFSKYLFFRNVITQEKREFIEKDDAIFNYNFLDNISQDDIKGSWTLSLDSTKSIVTVRSLLWPGYYFVHKAETNLYGGGYYGFGIKNAGLPFMI